MAPEFGPRGNASKDRKAKAKVLKTPGSQPDDTSTLYKLIDREHFDKGQAYRCKFLSKNVSWEVHKALAIHIITSSMTVLGKRILDGAQFAAATIGFSQEVIRRRAFSYFTALNQYSGSHDDLPLDFIAKQLTSERGKGCGIANFTIKSFNYQQDSTYV